MNRLSISRRVIVVFMCLIVVPFLAVTGYQEIRISTTLREHTIARMSQASRLYGAQIEGTLAKAESFINQLRMDEDLRTAVAGLNRGRTDGDTVMAFERFKASVTDYAIVTDVQIYSVCVTTQKSVICQMNNSRAAILREPLEAQSWYQRAIAAQGRLCWEGVSYEKKGAVLSIGCTLNGNDALDAGVVGALNVAFNANWVFPELDKAEMEDILAFYHKESRTVYGVDGSAEILLDAADGLIASGGGEIDITLSDGRYCMVCSESDRYGWSTLYAVPTEQITAMMWSTSAAFLAVSLACLLAILLFLFHMQTRLLSPLEDAIVFINENTLHHVELKSDNRGYPEIRSMRQRVALYASDQREAEDSLLKVSRQRDVAQLKRLQMQVNPHFLYNTLNSIKILADTGRAADASQMIHHLIHLLNACMDRSGTFVTVAQEMETLRHYLAIQKTVYGDTVEFMEDLRGEFDECEIPNFILQPIVENSLQHGLNLTRDDNRICISDREEDGALVIEVADNGMGILPERLARIRREMDAGTPTAHIGLSSVHQRIRLSCGQEYGVSLFSDAGEGVRVLVRLPMNPN